MTDKISDELRQFVIRQSCVEDEEITIETSLEEALGVTGDDATDFMVAYGNAFNVDVTNFQSAVNLMLATSVPKRLTIYILNSL